MRGIAEPDFLGCINGTMVDLTSAILCHTLRAWQTEIYLETCVFQPEAVAGEPDPEAGVLQFRQDANLLMSSEDLFARQPLTWATCPDWVQPMILNNIRETIIAKMKKEHGIQEDRGQGFTDDWEAVAAEVQSQMARWPPHGQLLGFRHAELQAFRHVQLHRLRVKLPASCVLEPWLEPRKTETIYRKLSCISISPRCRQPGYSTSLIRT